MDRERGDQEEDSIPPSGQHLLHGRMGESPRQEQGRGQGQRQDGGRPDQH